MDMDQTDLKILQLLVEDGRKPYREIAKNIDVTAPTVKNRVDKLKEKGVLKGYKAIIDEKRAYDKPVINTLMEIQTTKGDLENLYDSACNSEFKKVYKTAETKIMAHFIGTKNELEQELDKLPNGSNIGRTIIVMEETETKIRLPKSEYSI